jgi:hypothetical protein
MNFLRTMKMERTMRRMRRKRMKKRKKRKETSARPPSQMVFPHQLHHHLL